MENHTKNILIENLDTGKDYVQTKEDLIRIIKGLVAQNKEDKETLKKSDKKIQKLEDQNYKFNQKLIDWKTRARKIPMVMEKEYTEFIKNL